MTAPHADQLIDGYLARIQDTAGDLPAAARKELLDDMRGHIAEARAHESEETDAAILNILDRLGEPGVVVAEARERLGLRPAVPYRLAILEVAAVVLVALFWPVGVTLLWISSAWSVRDKVVGTLVPLLGVMALFVGALGTGTTGGCAQSIDHAGNVIRSTCAGEPNTHALVLGLIPIVLFGAPLIGAAYLAIRLRWGRPQQVAAA
jgi:hypothetical protein